MVGEEWVLGRGHHTWGDVDLLHSPGAGGRWQAKTRMQDSEGSQAGWIPVGGSVRPSAPPPVFPEAPMSLLGTLTPL